MQPPVPQLSEGMHPPLPQHRMRECNLLYPSSVRECTLLYPSSVRECVTVLRPAHTINVDTFAVVVQLIYTKSDSNPSPPFHMVGATGLGHQLLAAMVDVCATVCALDALPHETIEQAPTVVAPGGAIIVGRLKLVWDWFLKNVKCLSVSEDRVSPCM